MSELLKRFFPTAYYKTVYDIPLEKLSKRGIKGLIFDVDNTLAPYFQKEPDDMTVSFIKKALESGFKVCLLSNNSSKRVGLFNEKLKVVAVSRALKPSRVGLRKAMTLLGTDRKSTAIIGDQVFTDVWCGNRAGISTILVEPCCTKDELVTKVKRGIERLVVKAYLERRENVENRR